VTEADAAPTVLLVGRGAGGMLPALQAAAPAARFLVAPTAAAGEAHLPAADAVVMADRVRPAYLTAPRLRWLHIVGAGVDGFSIAGLRDAPFAITHKVEASIVPMAEHVMAQLLLIARRALEYRALQAERRWARHDQWPTSDLIELAGKTLGIIGLGRAGLAVARRARAFDLRVIGTKRQAAARLPHVAAVYPPDRLHALLAEADFVAILAPLTDATHRLIGAAELRAMKPTAYLINISRGPIIDEAALIRALRERWIAGAALDVFEHEPLDPASELWALPNAIITPHCGGVGPNLGRDSAAEVAANLRRFVAGRPLRHLLNRADIVTTFAPPSH
jgi:phosphoglycerate dehydrogenase-like enzyme